MGIRFASRSAAQAGQFRGTATDLAGNVASADSGDVELSADTATPSPIATPRPQPRSTPTPAPTAKKSRLIGVKARPTGHLLTVSDRILNRSRARLSVRMSRRLKRARRRVGGAFMIPLRVRRAPRRVTVRYGTLKRAVRTRRAAAG